MSPEELEEQLRRWFGSEVGVSAARIREVPLYEEELDCVAKAVPQRRAEFSMGRWCAREALQAMGFAPVGIPMGARRGPVWPPGATGSITHAGGLCAAVVGRADAYRGLGIDILEPGAASPIVEAAETFLRGAGEEDGPGFESRLDSRVLRFSAKESVIKTVSPEMNRWLDFAGIRVRFGPSSFQASVEGFPDTVPGWWVLLEDFVVTGAELRRSLAP